MRSFDKDIERIESIDELILPEPLFKFKRLEKKFLINIESADLLKGQIGFYLPEDKRTIVSPYISSIYYDNSEWKCYNEQKKKVNPRFKVRFRRYQHDSILSEKGFLEIKRKVNSTSIKDRFKINVNQLELLSDIYIPPQIVSLNKKLGIESLSDIYYKITHSIKKFKLSPVARVNYSRNAFENNEKTLRVTFDSNLEFRAIPNKFSTPFTTVHKMPDDFLIMEVKYAGKIPEWLTSLLKYNKLSKQHFSKYCTAIRSMYVTEQAERRPLFSLYNNKNNGFKEYGNSQSIILDPVQF
jgi:SPX domain protein involved in polyphosphate accumulation